MVKYLLNIVFIYLMLSSFSFAESIEDKLENEFGHDLTKAPFFLRFAYEKEFNKDWDQTDYIQRKVFLKDYETNLAAEQAKEKIEAKAVAAKEKERLAEKKAEQRQEKERLKAEAAEAKAEAKEEADRRKEFDDALKEQKKELEEMKQAAAASQRGN